MLIANLKGEFARGILVVWRFGDFSLSLLSSIDIVVRGDGLFCGRIIAAQNDEETDESRNTP